MNTPQEHADDLEPEVNDGAEVETEQFPDDDDLEESEAGDGDANPMSRVDEGSAPPLEEDEDQRKDDASDSI
jgi:hypothetical protein